jgi:cytoskeletal protein CcmA (bactofilin family)
MLFSQNIKDQCVQLIDKSFELVGGTIRIKNGVLIDGHLTSVTIVSDSDAPVIVSALGKLENCFVECRNFLNEGEFSGEANISGDVELGDTSTTIGSIAFGGRFFAGGPFADTADLKIKGLPKKNPMDVVIVDNFERQN